MKYVIVMFLFFGSLPRVVKMHACVTLEHACNTLRLKLNPLSVQTRHEVLTSDFAYKYPNTYVCCMIFVLVYIITEQNCSIASG